jgi:hypothetical protein
MPIVRENDFPAIFGELSIDSTINTVPLLPDIVNLKNTQDAIHGPLGQAEFKGLMGTIWERNTQKMFGAMVTSVGVPKGNAFDRIFETIQQKPWELDVIASLDDLLDGDLEALAQWAMRKALDLVGSIVDMVGGVPIIGWIIKIIWEVAESVIAIVQFIKGKKENEKAIDELVARAEFSPDLDQLVAKLITKTMHWRKDWTDLFMPPGMGKGGRTWSQAYWRKTKLEGGGVQLRSMDMTPGHVEEWTGFMPGTTKITRMYEFYPVGNLRFIDTGQYLPSGRDMMVTAWSFVTKNSPAMYTVDADKALDNWKGYLGTLRDFIQAVTPTGQSLLPIKTSDKKTFINKMGAEIRWNPYHPDDVVGNFKGYGIYDCRPVKSLERLKHDQFAYLDTITCAYLDRSFEAIKQDSNLRGRWNVRREALLEHPARCAVDLDNIPDPEYKAEMTKRVSGMQCAPKELAAFEKKGAEGRLIISPKGTIPVGPYQNPPGTGKKGGGGAGIALAALAGLAVMRARR